MGDEAMNGELRKVLMYKMTNIIAARDKVGDKAFAEGRSPTPEEWAEMARLQAQYENYVLLLNKFCNSVSIPEENPFEELLY